MVPPGGLLSHRTPLMELPHCPQPHCSCYGCSKGIVATVIDGLNIDQCRIALLQWSYVICFLSKLSWLAIAHGWKSRDIRPKKERLCWIFWELINAFNIFKNKSKPLNLVTYDLLILNLFGIYFFFGLHNNIHKVFLLITPTDWDKVIICY